MTPSRVALAPDQERELRVGLQAEHAVDDLRPGLLEPLGPVDVRFLVEARHQLDHDRHFLAAARRLDQRFHQHRVDAGAIDGLLDGDDVGIVGGAADELDDRLERLVGMVEQDVVRADRGEDVRLIAQPIGESGNERRIRERVDVDLVDQRREARDVDRPVAAVEVGVGELELLEQELRERLRTVLGDLEAHRRAELPVRQLALQRLAQVLHFLLVDPQVGVARHPELRVVDDVAARERDRQDGRGSPTRASRTRCRWPADLRAAAG